jgi:uncharacterized peroxidase-related enzyme
MRIEAKDIKSYPWYVRFFYSSQVKKYGAVLNSSLLWGRSSKLFLALSAFYGALDRKSSPISPAMRSLIILRVSQINVCVFCIDLNSSILMERGVSLDKVMELENWRESKLFSQEERVVLEYAEAMTFTDREVDDGLFDQLKELYTDDEIIELTATVAFQNMSTKFNSALGIPAQGFCKF